MKTMKLKFITLLTIVASIGGACSLDDKEQYCFTSQYTGITGVTGPSATTVNTPITLNVSYIPLGTCGTFNKFTETQTITGQDFPKDIKVLVDYEGCQCPATDTAETVSYTFTATTPGSYELNFLTGVEANPKITRTITVTE
ncbi:hypothetical protein [Flavobacterium suzhouense]|uniref:Lipoprotein n=1 Tax=Flavobacterium suzhouense TaxID=1529638 RepID=A0ABW5NSM5_9FLAO